MAQWSGRSLQSGQHRQDKGQFSYPRVTVKEAEFRKESSPKTRSPATLHQGQVRGSWSPVGHTEAGARAHTWCRLGGLGWLGCRPRKTPVSRGELSMTYWRGLQPLAGAPLPLAHITVCAASPLTRLPPRAPQPAPPSSSKTRLTHSFCCFLTTSVSVVYALFCHIFPVIY